MSCLKHETRERRREEETEYKKALKESEESGNVENRYKRVNEENEQKILKGFEI